MENKNYRIIAFGARKGGVGKTALTREMGARLASAGYRVAMVNADGQDTLTMVLNMEAEPGLTQIILHNQPVRDWLRPVPREVWDSGDGSGELYVIPNDETITEAGVRLIMENIPLLRLRQQLHQLLRDDVVDFVLVDTAPTIIPYAPWLYTAFDAVVIPTGANLEGIGGINKTREGFEMVSAFTQGKHQVDVIGIVPTQFLSNTNIHRKNWGEMQRIWRGFIWPIVEFRITWQYASQFRRAINVYAPDTEADRETDQVFKTLCEFLPVKEMA